MFVNLIGVGLNVYHVVVGASIAMCMWTLTGLLCASAVLFPWGARQALASIGAVLSYPLHLEVGTVDPLTWGAGGTYLIVVVGLSVFGAALLTRYVRSRPRTERRRCPSARRACRATSTCRSSARRSSRATAAACEVNDELCRMLGYEREELARTCAGRRSCRPTSAPAGAALFERALHGGDAAAVRRDAPLPPAATASRSTPSSRSRGLPGPARRRSTT